ncbi:MAG: hypothetical protein II704_02020 [Erysipelotrichaceae bacterium]|nr:hypothetical protein [Erysipelotrichaceae bacterium]
MNRNELVIYRRRFTRMALAALMAVLMITGAVFTVSLIKGKRAPEHITVVQPQPVVSIPEYRTQVEKTALKADKRIDDSLVVGGTKYSEVFRQGGHNKGADGRPYLRSLEMNTAHIDLNAGGYSYLKGKLVLSDYSKSRTYLRAQILIYDIGSSQPFYVSREMTENDRSEIELLVDLSGHDLIRIEIPYFRDLYLATDGLYLSDIR